MNNPFEYRTRGVPDPKWITEDSFTRTGKNPFDEIIDAIRESRRLLNECSEKLEASHEHE